MKKILFLAVVAACFSNSDALAQTMEMKRDSRVLTNVQNAELNACRAEFSQRRYITAPTLEQRTAFMKGCLAKKGVTIEDRVLIEAESMR